MGSRHVGRMGCDKKLCSSVAMKVSGSLAISGLGMRILTKYTGVFVAGVLLVVVLLPTTTDHLSAQIVPVLRIHPLSVRPGASVTATFSGRDYSDLVYFDVRFRQPESNVEQVALN